MKLFESSEERLDRYLKERKDHMAAGRELAHAMHREYTVAETIPPAELREISRNLDRAAEAQAKRERREAKRIENARRTAEGRRFHGIAA